MKDFSNHFRELVKSRLRDDPRILVPRGGQDMMILATWRLSGDAFRPHKRSRMIRIVIAQEALESYAGATDEERRSSDARSSPGSSASLAPSIPVMIPRSGSSRRP